MLVGVVKNDYIGATREEVTLTTSFPTSIDASRFDERTLLLLGVLLMENQHGYQINDFIEHRLGNVTFMKKPTAYALLERLANDRAVTVHTEQEGSRPQRKVYEITDRGRELFLTLLQRNLADSDMPRFATDIGLMFMNHLPPGEVARLLGERLRGIEDALKIHIEVPSHGATMRLDFALDHARAMREAERDWLVRTIDKLNAGA